MSRSTFRTVAYRYLSGRPLSERTGTWPYLSRGTGRWPGWQRQAVRVVVPVGVVAVLNVAATYPAATRAVAYTLAVAVAVVLRRRWRRRRFRRTYVSPTVRAIQVPMGTAEVKLHVSPGLGRLVARLEKPRSPAGVWVRERYRTRVEPGWVWTETQTLRVWWKVWRWIGPALLAVRLWFTRPRQQHGPRIHLTVAVTFVTAEQRSMISAIVKAKIPAGDLVESWNQVGPEVSATWVPRRRPPASVTLEHLLARFDALPEHEFYLGQGVGDTAVTVSLEADSPHFAVSAATGGGKSVLAMLVGVQNLRRGGRVVILDRKGSHRWAIGLAGVDYCTKPAEMHEALLREAAEADEWNTLAMYEPEGWDPGPRTLIICEELNATIAQLAAWWADVRDPSSPKRSPAIGAFNDLAYMGRSAKKNILAVAQMLTARATGGPEARENFGIRCLTRYTTNAWKMLVPEAAMPRASRTQGRWQIVIGGVATETQVCYLTHAQARAFARVTGVTKAENGLDRPMTRDVINNRYNSNKINAADDLADTSVTLQEAIDRGLLPWSADATKMRLSRARTRGELTPRPVGRRGHADLYHPDELVAWTRESQGAP